MIEPSYTTLKKSQHWNLYSVKGLPDKQVIYDELIDKAKQGNITLAGKTVPVPRLSLTISDKDEQGNLPKGVGYNLNSIPNAKWSDCPTVNSIREHLEKKTGTKFDYCAVNIYRNGDDYIGWHSDKEATKEAKPVSSKVFSYSFGATRKFRLKFPGETGHLFSINLSNNMMLLMKEGCQQIYQHGIPKEKTVNDWRINLTFRYD